jgi:peptide chain release factor 2
LEALQSAPDFWNDQENANRVLRKVQSLKQWVVPLELAVEQGSETKLLAEMVQEEEDEDSRSEVSEGVDNLEAAVEKLDFQFLLSGEEDARGAMLEIHPGAGGTESQDWAQMLLRMYTRNFERNGMKTKSLEQQA